MRNTLITVGILSGAALLAQTSQPDDVTSSPYIKGYDRIGVFKDDYSYAAYLKGIVIRQTASDKAAMIAVTGVDYPIRPGFEKTLAKNPELASRLGRSLSPVVSIFDGKLQVQLFEGGTMLYEPLSNNNWWHWHARRRDIPATDTIVLPKEPGAWIITLDYRGGLTLPRKNQDPFLLIRNDGRVIVNDPFGLKSRVETRISLKKIDELMRFALKENDFFALDGADIDRAVQQEIKKKRASLVTDGPNTVIRIRTYDKTHEVSSYAVGFYAHRLRNLAALQKLDRIETRLNKLMDQLRSE